MRIHISIFNNVPTGHAIAGGMCVPQGFARGMNGKELLKYIKTKKQR